MRNSSSNSSTAAYPQFDRTAIESWACCTCAIRACRKRRRHSRRRWTLAPANAVAGNELGIVERKLGKFAEAEAAYQRAIAAEPNYAPAHLNLGVLYDLYLGTAAESAGAIRALHRDCRREQTGRRLGDGIAQTRRCRRARAAPPEKGARMNSVNQSLELDGAVLHCGRCGGAAAQQPPAAPPSP